MTVILLTFLSALFYFCLHSFKQASNNFNYYLLGLSFLHAKETAFDPDFDLIGNASLRGDPLLPINSRYSRSLATSAGCGSLPKDTPRLSIINYSDLIGEYALLGGGGMCG